MPGSPCGEPGSRAVTAKQLDPELCPPHPGDLFVRALRVQGGEASIGGEKTAFARIIMTGVDMRDAGAPGPVARRQESAVLRLKDAASLALELREIMNHIARATPTPIPPASGTWSWTSGQPHAAELLVAGTFANSTAIPLESGIRSTVRVDFKGSFVSASQISEKPVHVQGAVFSSPRQVQALISSLKKVVRSSFEHQRDERYVSGAAPVSAFGF